MVFILTSCNVNEVPRGDVDVLPWDERRESLDYILIVKVVELEDTTLSYYFDNSVPKTDFRVDVIHSFKGDPNLSLILSTKGGYDDNNNFIGVYGDTINSEDATYNLLLENHYYLVMVYKENGDNAVFHFEELVNYDPTNNFNNQNSAIITIFEDYQLLE